MIEVQVFLFIINLIATCDISKRLSDLSIEMHYGTIPSESFPTDPRHRPQQWYEICGTIEEQGK